MPANYHRAVMKRRLRIKDAHQQIVAEFGIKFHTAVDDVFQSNVSLDHNQRAGLGGRQRRRSEDYFVINALAKLPQVPPRKRQAKAIAEGNQRLPDLVLKENDDGHADVEHATA